AHGVAPAVPEVEITDDAYPPGIRRKHRERHPRHLLKREGMRPELVVELQVRAFAKQMEIDVGEDGRKTIGIFQFLDMVAETRPHVIARRTVHEPSDEQTR